MDIRVADTNPMTDAEYDSLPSVMVSGCLYKGVFRGPMP